MAGAAVWIGLGLSVVGTIVSASAQARMAEDQKKASIRAENARRQEMELNANRKRRDAIRQMLTQRSTALTVGTAQGAGQGSGVAGAIAQSVATGNQQIQTVGAAEQIGHRVFDANIQYAKATARGQKGMAFGSALSSVGSLFMSAAPAFGRVATYSRSA